MILYINTAMGFSGGSVVRIHLPMEETWVPSLGQEDPGEGNSNALQDSCLGNPTDRGAWRDSPRGHKESVTTAQERERGQGRLIAAH